MSKLNLHNLSAPGLRCALFLGGALLAFTSFGLGAQALAGVTVAVSPANVTLPPGATLTFKATVSGTQNTAVTWSVTEGANGGSITSTGVYTATQTTGTYHVVATSQADPSVNATAVVKVQPVTAGAGFTPPTWNLLGPTRIPNAHSCDNANEANLLAAGRVQAFAVDLANPSVMYGGGGVGIGNSGPYSDAGVYESTDGGTHWVPKDSGLSDTHVDALWLDQANPQVLVATTFYGGIFYSTNGGANWTNVYSSSATAIVQAGSTLYVATGNGIVESIDNGATWQLVEATSIPVRALGWSQGALYAGLDNGTIIGRSAPGQPWQTLLQPGTTNTTAYDIAVNPTNPQEAIVVLWGPNGMENEVTQDDGSTWSTWAAPPTGGLCNSGGPGKVVVFDAVNPNIIVLRLRWCPLRFERWRSDLDGYASIRGHQSYLLLPRREWRASRRRRPGDLPHSECRPELEHA